MAAKIVSVSADGITYYNLPGSSADLTRDSAATDDSVFGSNFASTQPTLITWSSTSNGYFKGFAGYKTTIKRAGSPTAFTDEATTLIGGEYTITDRTKSVWAVGSVTVEDDGAPVDADDIEVIDYLHGRVKFVSGYTVTGAITVSGNYLPLTNLCNAQNISLSQTANTENVTDTCTASSNGGFAVFKYSQQTAELSLDGFYNDAGAFNADLISRDQVIIEIDTNGAGKSVFRGYFRAINLSQSGDVGATETESVTYGLSVPENVARPVSWFHTNDTPIPAAIKVILDAYLNRDELFYKYAPEDSDGFTGKVLVADASMETGVEQIINFTFNFQGTDALTKV